MESEIGYLSASFEEIVIFSINIKPGEKQTRITPNNVRVFPLNCGHSKVVNIFRGLLRVNGTYRLPKKGIKKIAACLYARGRFFRVFKKSLSILLKIHFNGNDTVFYSYWLTAALPSLELAKWFNEHNFSNVSTVSRGHGYDVYSERNQLGFLPFQKEYIQKLDEIDVCSDNGKDYLRTKYPNCAFKIFTSKLGTNDHGIEEYDPQGAKILVTCSRFRKIKRIPMFVNVFSRVLKAFPECKWICIGGGEEEETINDLIQSKKISNSIVMAGRLPNEEVLALYSKMSLTYFVNISTEEGLPVSIMEAMSFGIPAIATDAGGTGEIVDNSCGYLLSKTATVEEMADVIIKELRLPNEAYLLKREKAREKWLNNYSSDENYKAWANHLKNEN